MHIGNSSYGELPGGVTQEMLREAITRSGYPFQAAVANRLRESFDVVENVTSTIQEEWSYIDAESNETRSIDVLAEVSNAEESENRAISKRPLFNMLVECKQSEMPYIFFLRTTSPTRTFDFPEFAGAYSPGISIINVREDRRLACTMSVHYFLGTWDFEFFNAPTLFAVSLSKAARKGAKIELTGEEAYRSLTFPLFKASDYLKASLSPDPDERFPGCQMIICVAVLRAPMLGVIRSADGEDIVTPIGWARVCRLEPGRSDSAIAGSGARYYDVVHEEYLAEYMGILLRDAVKLGVRIHDFSDVIRSGTGIGNLVDHHEGDRPYDGNAIQPIDSLDDLSYLESRMKKMPYLSRKQREISLSIDSPG